MIDFRSLPLRHLYSLFSCKRISAYTSVNEHFDNFALIGSISQNIGIAEVLLRNKIDFIMTRQDALWLESPQSHSTESHSTESTQSPSKDSFISKQSLGFWLKVVECYKIHTQLFSKDFLENLDFKRYYARNANRFKNKANLQNYHKVSLLLHLLRNLRNRAFHFENLYKLNEYSKPRLVASIRSNKNSICVVNLETSKIKVFLEDLIIELSKREDLKC